MEIDIHKKTNDIMAELEQSGDINTIIKSHIVKMLDNIMSSIFASYSNVGKSLQEEISKKIALDLSHLKLENYNERVLKIVNDEIAQVLTKQTTDKITEAVRATLTKYTKKEIEFQEIVDKFKEEFRNEIDVHKTEEMYLEISKGYAGEGYHIYMAPNPKLTYTNRYNLYVGKDGSICSLRCPNKGEINRWDNFEKFLNALFYNGVKVTNVDCNLCDITYGDEED